MSRNLFWLSDEQWQRIEPHLPTDLRGVERRDVLGAPDGADTLDLGALGVDELTDLSFFDAGGGNWEITANADQFGGTIFLHTDGATLAEVQARIEFDGALG